MPLVPFSYDNDDNVSVIVLYFLNGVFPLHPVYLKENNDACRSQFDVHSCVCGIGVTTVVVSV